MGSADADVRLVRGWNLIGIPRTLKTLPGTTFGGTQNVWTTDGENMSVYDGPVSAGEAYWVFVDGDLSFSIRGIRQTAPSVEEITAGWSLMAYPGQIPNTIMYVYKNGRYLELTEDVPETTGVWIYK